MRGMDIFQKPYYREISTMRGRPMRGPPVLQFQEYIQTRRCIVTHRFFLLNVSTFKMIFFKISKQQFYL